MVDVCRPPNGALQGVSQAIVHHRDAEAKTLEYLQSWLPARLLERLFQMTQAITKHVLVGAAAPEAQFPRLPGSHLSSEQLGTPALAFVRTVCHVLALDSSIESEVRAWAKKLPNKSRML
jgi:hypothetical protein